MTRTIVMRRAIAADVQRILTLLHEDDLTKLPLEQASQIHMAAFAMIDKDQNQFLAVAQLGEDVVGCLQLTFIPGLARKGMWRAIIEGVRIDMALRNQGLGRQMLNWALDLCRQREIGMVQLLADQRRTNAKQFYKSLGFQDNHQGFRLYF